LHQATKADDLHGGGGGGEISTWSPMPMRPHAHLLSALGMRFFVGLTRGQNRAALVAARALDRPAWGELRVTRGDPGPIATRTAQTGESRSPRDPFRRIKDNGDRHGRGLGRERPLTCCRCHDPATRRRQIRSRSAPGCYVVREAEFTARCGLHEGGCRPDLCGTPLPPRAEPGVPGRQTRSPAPAPAARAGRAAMRRRVGEQRLNWRR